MKNLRVDIETFSSFDLPKVGVYRYAEAPDFEVMLFGYQIDDEPVRCIDLTLPDPETGVYLRDLFLDPLTGKQAPRWEIDQMIARMLPEEVLWAMTSPEVMKHAWNANFERVCLRKFFYESMDPAQWRCSMVSALYCGLPGKLEDAGRVLNAKIQKDPVGRALINYFCKPCKPTKKNGHRTRNLPHHDPERWALFRDVYCPKDVASERALADRFAKSPVPEIEWHYWALNQTMNDKGTLVDRPLIAQAIKADNIAKQHLTEEAIQLTGLTNPNSVEQLKGWLTKELDDDLYLLPKGEITQLTKKTIPQIIQITDDAAVQRVLELRLELGRASVKKYTAMDRAVCDDGRIRGIQQFYGANRTGRDAGRIVQFQNMASNKLEDLNLCRELLLSGDFDLMEAFFGSISFPLSQLVRTALIAKYQHVFAPVDFSAIEARGLAWVANEEWRMEVFRTHGQIYEASASQMFKVPWSEFQAYIDRGKKHPLRQKGKIAELALGYWGGTGALITMGALEMGLTLEELQPLVDRFREANPNIKKFTYAMGDAALKCVRTGQRVDVDKGIRFRIHAGMLLMRLQSGRELHYVKPGIEYEDGFGDGVTYWGVDQKTRQWCKLRGYGGKWVENWDQAFCRDLLYYKLARLEDEGLHDYVNFHVHDEVVPEIPPGKGIRQKIERVFGESVPWAPGMPLRGDGFETPYYQKDL